jgi:hypothetical protein
MAAPDQATLSMIANLEKNTGKTLAQWVSIAAKGGTRHGEIVKHLKNEHGLTHGYANLVAHSALNSAATAQPDDALLDDQYAGAKAGLRPIYERILEAVRGFGDVEVAPKKGYVSLRRSKQFALVQPSTASRVDVGIQLKGEPPGPRLEASGSFNAMVSHRVRMTDPKDVDKDLIGWLKAAWERA